MVKKLKSGVILGLVKRFTMPGDEDFHLTVHAITSFLDPRHKTLKYINNQAVQFQLKGSVLQLMRSEFKVKPKVESTEEPAEKKRKSVFSYLEGDYNSLSEDDPEDELMRYVSEPVMIRDPLQWWKHYARRFPTLAKLARKFLCIMGTSVPSERVFSTAGLTVTDKRSRLDSNVFNEIIFMNKVLQKKYRKNKECSALKIKKDPDAEETNSDEDEPPLPALY